MLIKFISVQARGELTGIIGCIFCLQVGRSVTGGGLISGHLPYGRPKHFDWAHEGANLFNLNSGQIFN